MTGSTERSGGHTQPAGGQARADVPPRKSPYQVSESPLFSIITPSLNGVRYLGLCLKSVLDQGCKSVEHVFVDGGSTDGTIEVLRQYERDCPGRVRLVVCPGFNAREAWNRGWEVAKGRIFSFMGNDDLLEPGALETVADFFERSPDAYYVYGGCNYINENGEFIRSYPVRDFDLDETINHECFIPTTSAFYRRELVERVGPMDTTINICDRDYWIRAGKLYKLHRIDAVLSNFRWHQGSITASKGHLLYAREMFIISQRYGARFFSLYRFQYYAVSVVEFLRPVLGWAYPALYRVVMGAFYPFFRRTLYPALRRITRSPKTRLSRRAGSA